MPFGKKQGGFTLNPQEELCSALLDLCLERMKQYAVR